MDTIPIEEQINSDNFFKFVDYFYSPREDYEHALQVLQKYPNMKMFSPNNPPDKKNGIIFVGMCCLVEQCLELMPEDGSYIVIQRDNERTFIEDYYRKKKASAKHIYTIECGVHHPDVTALPHGVASIEGPNPRVEQVRIEKIAGTLDHMRTGAKPIFCRLNTNKITHARTAAIESLRNNQLVDVVTEQLDQIEFYRQIASHKYCLSLQSGGKDTTRTWEALCLGTIPIISDCPELRHFEDMPIVFYPGDRNITQEWMDSLDLTGRSNKRATMSYWKNEMIERLCQY